MAERVTKKLVEEGVEGSQCDYYDILVIGSTGMGKSTTVEKMLIADFEGLKRERSGCDSQLAGPAYDENNQKLVCEDLTMWLVSDQPSSPEQGCHDDDKFLKVSTRLKNLVDFRSAENSHEMINDSHKDRLGMYENTLECELLSNERTKIRILDVPGFFGGEACANVQNPEVRASLTARSALSTMRKVLHIKNAHNLNFKRIVYFLPVRGVLNRTDEHFITELQIMENHFGLAIFSSMVVIATESSGAYRIARRHADPMSVMFTDEDFAQTRHHLQMALTVVFNGDVDAIPEPPIEFISLFDTCEEVLHKVQHAKVRKDSVVLDFKSSFCARCGVTIREEGKNDRKSSYCTFLDRSGTFTYDESTCHPVMVPKHSKVLKILAGILYVVTFRRFKGMWQSMDEVCIKCGQPPQSRGCMRIGTRYPGAKDGIVSHSHSAVESYSILFDDEEYEMVYSPPSNGAHVPTAADPTLPISIQQNHRHIQDGRNVHAQRELSPPDFDIKG